VIKKSRTVIPIFDWASLTLVVTDDMAATMKRRGIKGDRRAHYEWDRKDKFTIIFASQPLTNGAIAHEAGHCARDVLKESGIKITAVDDEAFAYLTDWLVRWITWQLRKARIRIGSSRPTGNGIEKCLRKARIKVR
jgi:hypothetical protein